MKSSLSIFTLFVSLLLNFATASCGHGTSLLRRKVHSRRQEGKDVKTVEVGEFGYIGKIGPYGPIPTRVYLCRGSRLISMKDQLGQPHSWKCQLLHQQATITYWRYKYLDGPSCSRCFRHYHPQCGDGRVWEYRNNDWGCNGRKGCHCRCWGQNVSFG